MTNTSKTIETPHLSMGRVALTVNDLDVVSNFYEQVVGLHPLWRDGETARLGAGNEVLLELRQDQAARRRSAREVGLFHTAFLLPTRSDLGRFVVNAMQVRTPVVGASDHAVSEALYLQDPEGNGIEIYTDRPPSEWRWNNGEVYMPSDRLDIQDLAASAGDTAWKGFPEGAVVGHVHLQVGAIAAAEAFYSGVLGLAITSRYPGGTFYAAGGYHHHIATNIWNSRGASVRDFPSTGLAEVRIVTDAASAEDILKKTGTETSTLLDPWGTPVAIVTSHDS